MDVLISIIVPVYNVERYLNQCLDSVIKQDINNIEIVVVNDGSTDGSLKICKEYSKKYNYVKLISQKNAGLSEARNTGIKNSCGKYIIFLDSDDFWMPQSMNKIIPQLSSDCDLLLLTATKLYDENIDKINGFEQYERSKIYNQSKVDALKYLSSISKFPVSACTKIIKRQLILDNELFFMKGLLSEDIDWSIRLLEKIETIDVCNQPFYVYRKTRQDSITNSISEKSVNDLYFIIDKWMTLYQENKVEEYTRDYVVELCAYELLILMANSYRLDKVKRKEIFKKIKQKCWILKLSRNKKIKLFNILVKLFGVNNISKILYSYIRLK
ncbi:MAG: glycosyltransferase [Turicibacter sp.]|nr:glycosyltransferase [Turicibacter sp.]